MSAETAMWKALARAVTCYEILNTRRSSEAEIKQDSKLFVGFKSLFFSTYLDI
jgi:hypothetical protein